MITNTVQFIVPCIVFLIVTSILYYMNDEKDNKSILLKNILPGCLASIIVFIILKYKVLIANEPLMGGNYFD